MKEEYSKYTQEFGAIGTQIRDISKRIDEVNRLSATTFETLKHKKDSFSTALNELKECKENMLEMNIPGIVTVEHNDFVNAFDSFIKGTEKTIDAIDLDTLATNKELLNEGFEQQKKGIDLAEPITNKIAVKLRVG